MDNTFHRVTAGSPRQPSRNHVDGLSADDAVVRTRAGPARISPPARRRLGLGTRLALSVALTVTGAMAVVSGLQLVLDFQAEQRERQSLLAVSLPPLISQLQDATTHEEVREVLTRFHGSYLERGHGHHQVRVVESDGRVLSEAGDKQDAVPARLAASAALRMPGLWPTSLSVVVTQGGTEITERRVNRWKAWAVHVGLTALLIVSLLLFVIRKQITTPVERLLQSIRKMELGYWDDMPDPGGAWELRWLASRFRLLTEAQSATLLQLLAAHRRAYEASAISRDAAHLTRVLLATKRLDRAGRAGIAMC